MNTLQKELLGYQKEIAELEKQIVHLRLLAEELKTNLSSEIDVETPFSQFENFPAMSKIILIQNYYHYDNLTIADYLYLTDEEILRVPGVGKKTLTKISKWLTENGFTRLSWKW